MRWNLLSSAGRRLRNWWEEEGKPPNSSSFGASASPASRQNTSSPSTLTVLNVVMFTPRSDAVLTVPVSAAQEVEQRGVDLAGVGPGDRVRAALDHGELHVADQAGQPLGGLVQRQHQVGIAVQHQYRHIDRGQVGAEVGGPGADAGHRGGGRRGE